MTSLHRTALALALVGGGAVVLMLLRGREAPPRGAPPAGSRRVEIADRRPADTSSDVRMATAPSSIAAERTTERIRQLLLEIEPVLPGEVESATALELLRWWAEKEPVAAIEFAARSPALHGRPGLVAELFVPWLDRQRADALSWALALAPAEVREKIMPSVISLLAAQQPEESMRMLGELQGENRGAAIAALFSEWSAVSPLRAVQAAGQLRDPGEQNRALREVLGKWMDREPEAAMAWARQRPPDPPPDSLDVMPSVIEVVLEKWSARAPAEAASYVMSLPEAPGKPQLLAKVTAQWSGQDARAALDWAAGLAGEADRTLAVREVLATVAQADFRRAAELAATVPPAHRRDGLNLVIEQWKARDRTGLSVWVERLSDPTLRQQVQEMMTRAP